MKPDEVALLKAVRGGEVPRDAGDRLGIPPKRVVSLCEKWATRGAYEYGVSADLGWVTDPPSGEFLAVTLDPVTKRVLSEAALLGFVQARAKEQHEAALADAHAALPTWRRLSALSRANEAHGMRNDVLDCRRRGGEYYGLIRQHAAKFSEHPDFREEWF